MPAEEADPVVEIVDRDEKNVGSWRFDRGGGNRCEESCAKGNAEARTGYVH
jgi:hypothetical protein